MGPNFAECAKRFLANTSLSEQYGWKGPVWYVNSNSSTQISYEGCLVLCGPGADYYPWSQIASTITTWILPIVGIILQAPFESNQPWATMWALARWAGSPIASMSYIIWNIKITAKCALMVDMSCSSSADIPRIPSDYSDMRDSLYILSAMNQYSMKPIVVTTLKREAEGLLRIALFSKDLQLRTSDKRMRELHREIMHSKELRLRTSDKTLGELRREVAHKLREHRKRGVVPVFISIMWFIFSLIISIQSSFGLLGNNTTAHDLATGLLMSWLPVLILASIVDRNFNSPEVVRKKLNLLINRVCDSLEHSGYPDVARTNEEIRRHYIDTFEDAPQKKRARMTSWVDVVSRNCGDMRDFFVRFAGQGRERWHYGAAHPILTSIEKNYIAEHRRPWLAKEHEARLELVLSDPSEGLIWFDWREIWQVLASCAVVFCSVAGAFLLSFSTPTVGLGCRSGYFMIYFLNSFVLALLEFSMWPKLLPKAMEARLRRPSQAMRSLWADVFEQVRGTVLSFANYSLGLCRLDESYRCGVESSISNFFDNVNVWGGRQWAEYCLFRPLELTNLFWLAYIVIGQAVGAYQTCYCQASSWNIIGGYIDFTQYALSDIPLLHRAWPTATAISAVSMGISMILVVREWCLQSHLSTQSYTDASSGLRRTRIYRRLEHYSPVHFIYQFCSRGPKILLRTTVWLLACLRIPLCFSSTEDSERSSLTWQWHDDPINKQITHIQGSALDESDVSDRASHDCTSVKNVHDEVTRHVPSLDSTIPTSMRQGSLWTSTPTGLTAPTSLQARTIARRPISASSRSSNDIPLIQISTPSPIHSSNFSDGSLSYAEQLRTPHDDESSIVSWDMDRSQSSG